MTDLRLLTKYFNRVSLPKLITAQCETDLITCTMKLINITMVM